MSSSSLTIETSLAVESRVGVWDWPCCCRRDRQWVNRENLSMARVTGLEDLLDTIDLIFTKTSLTPLLWLLFILFGGVATIFFFEYDVDTNWLVLPWLLPNLCLQLVYGSLSWRRYKCFSQTLEKWNRDVGESQGVCVKAGIKSRVTGCWKFLQTLNNCNNCGQATLHVCRTNGTLTV